MKLPKQWKHWVSKNGIRSVLSRNSLAKKYRRKGYNWFTLKGKGHLWRVNINNEVDIGETYDTFDRWANSIVDTWISIPQTEYEFNLMLKSLLQSANNDAR